MHGPTPPLRHWWTARGCPLRRLPQRRFRHTDRWQGQCADGEPAFATREVAFSRRDEDTHRACLLETISSEREGGAALSGTRLHCFLARGSREWRAESKTLKSILLLNPYFTGNPNAQGRPAPTAHISEARPRRDWRRL